MSTPILATKLYTPPVRPELVGRPQLVQRLQDGLNLGHKLTLVSAPAGFGKTTIIIEWLNQFDHPFTWLSLDEGDNDSSRFLTYFVAALQRLNPSIGQNLSQSAKLPPPETLITLLINDLTTLAPPFIMVLDDYHLLNNEQIHKALEFLLDHQPPQMHLVLTSREDPPLPLSRLRVRGQMSELRQDDLRFDSPEVDTFLKQTTHLNLTNESVKQLTQRTEGWVAGLQLAALSLRGYDAVGAKDFISHFSGSHHYIIDYLVEEVIQQQSDDIRQFLQQTAILDRMSAPLCDAVTGRTDGQEILTQLEHANLFLIPLDEHRQWYRYHHLFSEFLRTETAPDEQETLHQAASTWFAEHNSVPEAIKHAFASNDLDTVSKLIKQAADGLLQYGELTTLQSWLDALPDKMLQNDFELATYRSWVYWLTGQGEAAMGYVDIIEGLLHDDIPRSLHNKFISLQACLTLTKGNPEETIQLAQSLIDDMSEVNIFYISMALLLLSEAQGAMGNTRGAIQTLEKALALGRESDDHFMTIGVMVNLADQLNYQGKRRQAMALCQQVMTEFVDARGEPWPLTGLAYITLGAMLYEGGDLASAETYLEQGLTLCDGQAMMGPTIQGRLWQAMLNSTLGHGEKAIAQVQNVQDIVRRAGFEAYLPIFEAFEAYFELRRGNQAAAEAWTETIDISSNAPLAPLFELMYCIYIRVNLRREQADMEIMLDLLDKLEQMSKASGRGRVRLTTYILRSLVHLKFNQEQDAVNYLEQALQLATPEGYLRPFLDEETTLATLLPKVRHVSPEFVDKLLAGFAEEGVTINEPSASQINTTAMSSLIEPLSQREIELLTLVAAGQSNSEIADTLFITVGTVKKHLNNIFGKLGVKNRTQAAAKARELGLAVD